MLLIPFDGRHQRLREVIGGFVVQDRLRLGQRGHANFDIGEGMLGEPNRDVAPGKVNDLLRELKHRDSVYRISDVKVLSDCGWTRNHLDNRVAKIRDVAPGAYLRAVSVHIDRPPGQRTQDEALYRVSPETSWTEHIKWAYGHHGRPTLAVVSLHQMFPGKLGDRVAPACLDRRPNQGWCVLLDAEGIDPEDLARRKVDEALQAGISFKSL